MWYPPVLSTPFPPRLGRGGPAAEGSQMTTRYFVNLFFRSATTPPVWFKVVPMTLLPLSFGDSIVVLWPRYAPVTPRVLLGFPPGFPL